MKVYTKQMRNGEWSCYVTIGGYDVQRFGSSIRNAQRKMMDATPLQGVNIEWVKPEYYVHEEVFPKPYVRYGSNRIDNL